MGRFLSGLSWSQPVAAQASALGLSLPAVQALVGSRDAQVVHVRLHRYVFSLEGVRVVVDSLGHRTCVGSPVVVPSTGSDNYRGLRNSVAEIRRRFGIDLREY